MSMPTCSAIDRAVSSLSPVNNTGARPMRRNSAIASALVGFGWSATTNTARADPPHAATTAVWPAWRAVDNASFNTPGTIVRFWRNNSSRPTDTFTPSTTPRVPRPGNASNASTLGSTPTSRCAAFTMATPMGCSLACSSAPTKRSASTRSTSSANTRFTSSMRPVVTVPVLSRTNVSMRRVLCNTSTPLMTMPIWAARPLPTINAVGVANPNAHGHAMINTATAALTASEVGSPRHSQNASVPIDMVTTVGTNTPLTRSAMRCTGAFVAWASRTNLAIVANWVSRPTRVAFTNKRPFRFTVAPITASPT